MLRPAGELDHHGETALHVRRTETVDRALVDPARKIPLRGNGVGVPCEEHERLPRTLGVHERLAVVMDERGGHLRLRVRVDSRLLARRGRDVHELERPLRESRVFDGNGHNGI